MEKRTKSIVQKDMSECYVCREKFNIRTPKAHIHELLHGSADRKKSIKWGLYVGICAKHHNEAHLNGELDKWLKKVAQKKFEELYGKDKFIDVFKKNYL